MTGRASATVLHAADCAPCDAARAVVAALRDQFDPLDNWDDTELPHPTSGQLITVTELAVGIAAGVLHQYPVPASGGAK